MNIIITGGSGFIGSSLVVSLIKRSDINKVIVIDIVDQPDYLVNDKLIWLKCSFLDIPDDKAIQDKIKKLNVKVVFHLATTMFPKMSAENPVRDLLENGAKSIAFCDSMYNLGVEKIIYASSGGLIYGNNPNQDYFDENCVVSPNVSYGIVKRVNEEYLSLIANRKGCKFISLRISNPYGTMQNKVGTQGVIPIFINSILNKKTIILSESELSCRDYIYIDDLIDIFNKALDYNGKHTIFNAASGVSHSLKEIIESIENITNSKAIIKGLNSDSRSYVRLSNEKAVLEFGWKPKVNLSKGIHILVDSFSPNNKI
ncbi:NAD-dependent epimerase/dehydratase family protein [Vibrio fluvialis]|nr:NAD-dependent epimerase/dehydratase family protein [Vibrio fluvialis]